MDEAVVVKPVPKWVEVMRWILLVGLWLFLAGILVQALLAGRGIFGASSFEAHAGLGWPLAHTLAPLLLIVSFLTRIGWMLHTLTAVGFVLALVLPILPTMEDAPNAAALHPLFALVTFAIVFWVTLRLQPMVITPRTKAATPA